MDEPKDYLQEPAFTMAELAQHIDELPLWSAPFGLRLLEHVPVISRGRILDVGSGTGYLAIELAERCGPAVLVYALDTWKEGLEKLQRKVEFRQLKNLEILLADGIDMPLASASIDVIVCSLGINNFADPIAVLRECHRVAKPRATMLVATNLVGHMAEFYEVFREVVADICGVELMRSFDHHVAHRGTVESTSEMIQAAGFLVEQVQQDSFSMRFASGTAMFHHTLIQFGFLPAWKDIVPTELRQRVFEQLESRLNEAAAQKGELRLTIPVGLFQGVKK